VVGFKTIDVLPSLAVIVTQVIFHAVIFHKSALIACKFDTLILLAVTAHAANSPVSIEFACISFPVIVFAAILSAVINVLCLFVPNA
jgi:hypothetical protein